MMNLLTSPPCNSPCVSRSFLPNNGLTPACCPTQSVLHSFATGERLCHPEIAQHCEHRDLPLTAQCAHLVSQQPFLTVRQHVTACLAEHDDVLVSCRSHPGALPAAILSTVQQLRSLWISETCRFRIFGVHPEHNPLLVKEAEGQQQTQL